MMAPGKPDPGELVRCDRCGWLGSVAQAVAKVDSVVVCPRCGALVYRVMPGGYKTKGMKTAGSGLIRLKPVRYIIKVCAIGIGLPVCECGGDKAGTTHSTWCPKHA